MHRFENKTKHLVLKVEATKISFNKNLNFNSWIDFE